MLPCNRFYEFVRSYREKMILDSEKHIFGPKVDPVMEVWKKIVGYVTFRKPNPEEPTNFNLKVMHGINKVSIFMFLICLILLMVKWLA